ncbi:MAG: hypothetical protein HYV94_17910 [Candidatus Rokubacteria bacterium]|nr:hypothetical protein [Candidatus Rokubacteria bacterium]MBI2493957.1 hypothetical protein [Candidatus Rokubacteria bacterium]
MAIVREARTDRPLADATIDVLTLRGALVKTLVSKDGQARQMLKEGGLQAPRESPAVHHPGAPSAGARGPAGKIRLQLAQHQEKDSPLDKAAEAVERTPANAHRVKLSRPNIT